MALPRNMIYVFLCVIIFAFLCMLYIVYSGKNMKNLLEYNVGINSHNVVVHPLFQHMQTKFSTDPVIAEEGVGTMTSKYFYKNYLS